MISSFSFASDPGLVYVFAWSDDNLNDLVDDGDFFGVHPSTVLVLPSVISGGIDVPIDAVVGLDLPTLRSDVQRALESGGW